MDARVLRAWWFERQGLGCGWNGLAPSTVLERSGWARSVGGVNPYLSLFARARTSREQADRAVADLQIHELPSARGCTYVVPNAHFTLALKVGQPVGDPQEIRMAKQFLGVTDAELERLSARVLEVLADGPKDPAGLKEPLGDAVRSLGPEGKKRGSSTTLPMVLGRLQASGHIRRQPVNGRLDQQRYFYALWKDGPSVAPGMTHEEAYTELARLYWRWIGPASLVHFQWFSGLGVKVSKDAVAPLGLAPLEATDLLMFPDDKDSLLSYRVPSDPSYSLVSSTDAILLLRRDLSALVESDDLDRETYGDSGGKAMRTGIQDLSNHAIIDRGRAVGVWEYDSFANEIVANVWTEMTTDLKTEIAKTEEFVREQLGDARSFSLDSPESRKPAIQALRAASAVTA